METLNHKRATAEPRSPSFSVQLFLRGELTDLGLRVKGYLALAQEAWPAGWGHSRGSRARPHGTAVLWPEPQDNADGVGDGGLGVGAEATQQGRQSQPPTAGAQGKGRPGGPDRARSPAAPRAAPNFPRGEQTSVPHKTQTRTRGEGWGWGAGEGHAAS